MPMVFVLLAGGGVRRAPGNELAGPRDVGIHAGKRRCPGAVGGGPIQDRPRSSRKESGR